MLRRRTRLASVLASACLGAAMPVGAQTFAGQVVDSVSQRPLAGMLAGLVDPTEGLIRATRTDAIGAFYLEAPRAGRFHVVLLPAAGRPFVAPVEAVPAGAMVQHVYRLADTTVDRTIHLATEVTEAAAVAQWAPKRLHDEAVRRGESGWVAMAVVVGADGRVEPPSVWQLGTSHAWFADAMRQAITETRVTPARKGGVPVRQLRTFTADFGPPGVRPRGDVTIRYGAVAPR